MLKTVFSSLMTWLGLAFVVAIGAQTAVQVMAATGSVFLAVLAGFVTLAAAVIVVTLIVGLFALAVEGVG